MIEFEVIEKDDIRIIIKDKYATNLTEDEKCIFEILLDAAGNSNTITIKEFEKYAKVHYEKIYNDMNSLIGLVGKYEERSGKIDLDKKEVQKKLRIKFSIYLVITFILLPCGIILVPVVPVFFIGLILCTIVCARNVSKINILSERGYQESKQWLALKKYMEDYSLLKEKNVPDIVLWEKFLVYATVFGISKNVIKQLKVVHPELFDTNNQTMRSYGYWNVVCNERFGSNGFDSLSHGLEKVYTKASSAYSAAHSSDSSGSGGGGGFSSGGGGGSGGGGCGGR